MRIFTAILLVVAAGTAQASDPIKVSVDNFRTTSNGRFAVVVKIENLTDQRYNTVFVRCNFSEGGRVRISQPKPFTNVGPRAVKYDEVTADAIRGASVDCVFDFLLP